MARVIDITGRAGNLLLEGWEVLSTPAGAIRSPEELGAHRDWIAASVPGTVAAALHKAGRWSPVDPQPLAHEDHWFRTRFSGWGAETLRFGGLATLATVWLNGEEILSSSNMFLAHDVDVNLVGENELVICFRSLQRALEGNLSAGRWRPRMITPSGLRHFRTTVLGHMPGWCPPIPTIGPWRAVERIAKGDRVEADIKAHLEGTIGVLDVTLAFDGQPEGEIVVTCAGQSVVLSRSEPGICRGRLKIDDVELWWPHTHGEPTLHAITATIGTREVLLGRTGFRSIEVDRGSDGKGFALRINGQPIFCRGAVWSCADLVEMPTDRGAFQPWLNLARDAGMNMIRVPGTTVYEADAFYDLCDELGLLVWQDFMFANFDYPAADAEFCTSVVEEARQFVRRTAAAPSLAVLCGGSEVYQQGAMLGFPERKFKSPVFEEWLPEVARKLRADVPYVQGSPSGGVLPFVVDEGVGHYFGVGGYKRPLSDARHAGVRFASECLAFANVPPEITAPSHEPPLNDITDARWKARVPRDAGSSWDFEDVRDHYLEALFDVHAAQLRCEDRERYLELSRATQAMVMEHVLAEWMRNGSTARGGLVLMLQDLAAGAGWGLVSACGAPKSSWYALKRLFRPVRVSMTDEGVNGLAVHVANETAKAREVELVLTAWRDGRTAVLNATRKMVLQEREWRSVSAYEVIGSFFDISCAYRFNPPQHDATVATLLDAGTGEILSEAFHFPCGHARGIPEGRLSVSVERDDSGWVLVFKAERIARFVHVVDPGFLPEDDWFHVAPKVERRVRLVARSTTVGRPKGCIRALNMPTSIAYEATA